MTDQGSASLPTLGPETDNMMSEIYSDFVDPIPLTWNLTWCTRSRSSKTPHMDAPKSEISNTTCKLLPLVPVLEGFYFPP